MAKMNFDCGLTPEVIENIQKTLAVFLQVKKAILYGSRAKGNYRIGSDIDLALVASPGAVLDLTLVARIDNALDDLMLPYTFDLSVLADIDNPNLVDHIKRVGVVFFEREISI